MFQGNRLFKEGKFELAKTKYEHVCFLDTLEFLLNCKYMQISLASYCVHNWCILQISWCLSLFSLYIYLFLISEFRLLWMEIWSFCFQFRFDILYDDFGQSWKDKIYIFLKVTCLLSLSATCKLDDALAVQLMLARHGSFWHHFFYSFLNVVYIV